MAQDEFRIFLSAVSSEFGKARDAIANDLGSRDLLLRVQRSFRQEDSADTLLQHLHDYIRDCRAVVCVIGKRSGTCPPTPAAARFAHMLPDGIKEASYTQWEFFFARYYRLRLSIYIAAEDCKPEQDAPTSPDHPDLQAAFRQHIVDTGLFYGEFTTEHQLCRAVLKEDWPKKKPPKPIHLPCSSLGTLFKGRDEFMRKLRLSLTSRDGRRTAIVSNALYGLGGVGKSRMAVEYAWAHREDYTALLFVIAETPEGLRRNLAALTSPLLLPEGAETDEAVRLHAVLGWLKSNPGWLLILDNVDSAAALAEVERLSGQLTGGHVVMTTRLSNFPAGIAALALDVLPADAAADFLRERTAGRRRPEKDDDAQADELAQELGYLALALEHAGAYINRQQISFAGYLGLCRDNLDRVLDWSDPGIAHYPRAIAVTWKTSVDQLAEPARHLLERLAWIAPHPVPEFLLDVEIPGAGDLREALADLAAYSLVTRDPDEFTIHRLVQAVTRRSLEPPAARCRLEEALGWIDDAFIGEPDDVRDWPRLDPLAPHVRAVTGHADADAIVEPTGSLMNHLGVLLHVKALYAEAEPLYRRALAIAETHYGPDHTVVATRRNNLAGLLQDTNRPTEAEKLRRQALTLKEKNLESEDPRDATDINNLATLLHDTNRPAEAEPMYRRALAIAERNFGTDHPTVATCLNNLATLLHATNRVAEAEKLFRRALAIDEQTFGRDHPHVATNLNNLAGLLRVTNRLADAEPMCRRALLIWEKHLGPDHPTTVTSRNNLAILEAEIARSGQLPFFARVRAIGMKAIGALRRGGKG